MADIAQILLLPPPPVRTAATGRALAPQGSSGGASRVPEDGSNQDGLSVNDQTRARRFRFRVYEGGEASQTGTQIDARRAGGQPAVTASSIDLGNSDQLDSQAGRSGGGNASRFNSNTGASSAFLAQSIAQEQLGNGLHNPPHATAAAAYTSTGASLDPRPSAGLDINA
jgi:hypothetical protein